MDWQCINCPWFINDESTNYQYKGSFCLWNEMEEEEKEE